MNRERSGTVHSGNRTKAGSGAVDSLEPGQLQMLLGVFQELYTAGESASRAYASGKVDGLIPGVQPYRVMQNSRSLQQVRVPWEGVPLLLRNGEDQPRMDLIVRIADHCVTTVQKLGRTPRKILRQVRQKTPVGKVQRMDRSCMEWLVRQPGRSAREKSGPEQKILAVSRVETHDVLENRVLKDFLVRCARMAEEYLLESARYRLTSRYRDVFRFHSLCRHILRTDAMASVPLPGQLPSPNYVLQYDSDYGLIWKWYLILIQRQAQTEELRNWEHHLWSDVARLFVAASLQDLRAEGCQVTPLSGTHLRIHREHQHGHFLKSGDWPAPWHIVDTQGHEALLSLHHPGHTEDPPLQMPCENPDLILQTHRPEQTDPDRFSLCAHWEVWSFLTKHPDAIHETLTRMKARRKTVCDIRILILIPEDACILPEEGGMTSDIRILRVPYDPDQWFQPGFHGMGSIWDEAFHQGCDHGP